MNKSRSLNIPALDLAMQFHKHSTLSAAECIQQGLDYMVKVNADPDDIAEYKRKTKYSLPYRPVITLGTST